ncbi:MAG: 4a-hydroxytetrahydrobiopterin dehydratase [Kangiellaceae bacterium]|nr:4a-hydroxytetrahydrobiopterin dehydratase [Kangiellaceae bacterium]
MTQKTHKTYYPEGTVLPKKLSHWVFVEPVLILENPHKVLYRSYQFSSFEQALRFMSTAADGPIAKFDHHPCWANSYNRLQIWLSTTQSGGQVTEKDIELASALEYLWETFEKKSDLTLS